LRAFRLGQCGHDTRHRGLERECLDSLTQPCDQQCLGIALRSLRAQLQLEAVLLQAAGLDRMGIVELGGLEIVLGALEVPFGNHVDAPGLFGALELAFGRGDLHTGQVAVLAALEDLAAHLDGLSREVGLDAVQRGAFPIELIGEGGALHDTEDVSRFHGVAGAHLIYDDSRRLRKQGGAHGGHHRAGRCHVAHERPARDRRGPHAIQRDHLFARQPGARAPDQRDQQQRGPDGEETVLAPQRLER
jgi:hypothetical protein